MESWYYLAMIDKNIMYRQVSDISRTLVGN